MTAYPTIRRVPFPASTAGARFNSKTHEKDAGGFPWLIRPVKGSSIELKLPYQPSNRAWLKSGFSSGLRLREKLVLQTNSWLISKSHFELAAREMAARYGKVEIYMQFKESVRCNSNCQNAGKDECFCSCLGRYHGGGIAPARGWKVHEDKILSGGVVEVHSTLRRGHSMDGMFR